VVKQAVVFNPKSHPVAVSSDGTKVAGLHSAVCDLEDPEVKIAVEVGHLVIVSVGDPTEVTNFSAPTFTEHPPAAEQLAGSPVKKRSPRKKPAEAKEN
jgi:hypothetical protein